jgi:hypothetical protein
MASATLVGTEFNTDGHAGAGKTIYGYMTTTNDNGVKIHTLSNNVDAYFYWNTQRYSSVTSHSQGTKHYGVTSERTRAYWTEKTTLGTITSDSATFEADGWSSF